MEKEERETVGKQKSNRWHGKLRKKKLIALYGSLDVKEAGRKVNYGLRNFITEELSNLPRLAPSRLLHQPSHHAQLRIAAR